MLHVVVVGGGPAGLVAAEALAGAGVRATVIESHPDRQRPCAGLILPATLEALSAPELLLAQRVTELALFGPSLQLAFLPLGAGDRQAGTMRRELLQALLRRRATDAGAVLKHARFRGFVHGEGDYPVLEVVLPDGTRERIDADVVIAADGVHSRVAQSLGLPALERGVAFMERLSLPKAPAAMQIHLGRRVSADRFGWMLPQLDQVVLGVATHVRYGKRVWDNLADLKRRLGSQIDGAKPAGREAFIFPLSTRSALVHGRVLFVGDAAGAGAAATIDGLYHAVWSGRAAADTVLAHRNMPLPENLADYETGLRAAMGPAMAAGEKLERLFFVHDKRREALVELARDPELQKAALDGHVAARQGTPVPRLTLRQRARIAAAMLKHSLSSPRRGGRDIVAQAMPRGENYLDLALSGGAGLATLPPLRDVLGEATADEEPRAALVVQGADEG